MKKPFFVFALLLIGAGCVSADAVVPQDDEEPEIAATATLPVEGYREREERAFGAVDLGSDIFALEFTVPENMEVEYIPSIQALNIFTLDGEGTARERSQIFIRYFDASEFLTLSTVTVHSTETLRIGEEMYDARRYDIEKRDGVADFAGQPSWRNTRHIVTDFTNARGYSRYYVIAAAPTLDVTQYEKFLEGIRIVE